MNKFNKKILVSLIALFFILPCFPAYAEDSTPTVSLSSVTGSAGEDVTVDVIISNNPGIAYLKLEIDYDSSLSLLKAENKGVLSGTFTTSKTTLVKPYILQWMGASNSDNNGVIATVTFKVPDNAGAGDKAISVKVVECYNEAFDDVILGTADGKITVTGTDPGPGGEPSQDAGKITISSGKAKTNGEISLYLSVADNPGMAYLKLKLDYDNSALSLTGAKSTGIIGGTFTTSKTTDVKPYILQWMGADDSLSDGIIAEVTFKAPKAGTYPVTVEVAECYNSEFDDVLFDTVNGSVDVMSYVSGDITGDGAVNNKDLTRLFQHLSGWRVVVNEPALDVNGDGKVNNKDITRLFKYLSGWDLEIG